MNNHPMTPDMQFCGACGSPAVPVSPAVPMASQYQPAYAAAVPVNNPMMNPLPAQAAPMAYSQVVPNQITPTTKKNGPAKSVLVTAGVTLFLAMSAFIGVSIYFGLRAEADPAPGGPVVTGSPHIEEPAPPVEQPAPPVEQPAPPVEQPAPPVEPQNSGSHPNILDDRYPLSASDKDAIQSYIEYLYENTSITLFFNIVDGDFQSHRDAWIETLPTADAPAIVMLFSPNEGQFTIINTDSIQFPQDGWGFIGQGFEESLGDGISAAVKAAVVRIQVVYERS